MNLNNIKDDNITIIKNDLQKIIARPTMYISSVGPAGVLHLCKEIIDNNRDECYKKESPGNHMYVEITNKYILSKDNGRGIPIDLVQVVHETLQAGSNMTRSSGSTAGENGTGTSTYTAMARRLEITSLRPQEKKKCNLIYENGVLKSKKVEPYDGPEHGMITKFWPSKTILGTDEIPVDDLVNWISEFKYTLPEHISMDYSVNGKPFKILHTPIHRYYDECFGTDLRLCDPVIIKCKGTLDELVMDKKYKREFEVEAAILYSDPKYRGGDIRKSWMNMIYTPQNGSHMQGVINGFTRCIKERIIKKNKKLENDDLNKDIEMNLCVVVKASSNCANMFSSQAKHTVFLNSLMRAISASVYTATSNLPNDVLDEIVNICIANNRVRREGEKARDVTKLTRETKSWSKPDSFQPCSSVKTEQEKELFLVEGLSAGGGLRAARDARYQAILAFRGKSPNIWNYDVNDVLKMMVYLNLVKILGTGIGPNFNIKKINYRKVIIATDADIDGYHIRTLFLTFFFKFMPQIIEEGMLYVAEPPLYQLKQGNRYIYVANQQEYIEECINSIGNIEINFPQR